MEKQISKSITVDCCIAGGGPAGMMLGYLLARAGIKVVVLEKHKDFFRDFRGDTIHPSTIQIMYELGLLDEFLKVPHQEIKTMVAQFNDEDVPMVDFTHLPVAYPRLGIMPQWDFLNFLADHAKKYPAFNLLVNANVTSLMQEHGKVTGVYAETPEGTLEVKARLVVATDGRNSTLRQQAGMKVITTSVPIDVLWFRVSRKKDDPDMTFGRFNHGKIMVLLNRDEYWQCAYVVAKGDYEQMKKDGLEKLRERIAKISPFLKDRVDELKSLDDIKLLSVVIDHLEHWAIDGLLCIGDAAHAMSPIGGVGVNLAVQDAVAAANLLYGALKEGGDVPLARLLAVQKRRTMPTYLIQKLQTAIQNGMVKGWKDGSTASKMPLFMKMLQRFPVLRRIPARIVGLGVRPEHVHTPEAK